MEEGQPLLRRRRRGAPALRRLQLGVVLRDLPAAVRLADRLHRPARLAVRRPAPRPPAGRPPAARPAPRPHHLAHREDPRRGPLVRERAALLEALPHRAGYRPRRRGEGLPPRGGEPALPRRADRDAGGLRLGAVLQVRGRQAGPARQRLLEHAHPVRRLQARHALPPGRPAALQLHAGPLRRHLRDGRPAAGHPARLQGVRHPHRGAHGTPEKREIQVNEPLEIEGPRSTCSGTATRRSSR